MRRVTGYQDFVDQAPLDLVYVTDHGRMTLIPVASRKSFASAAASASTENGLALQDNFAMCHNRTWDHLAEWTKVCAG